MSTSRSCWAAWATASAGLSNSRASDVGSTASGSTSTRPPGQASCTSARRGKYVRSRWNSVSMRVARLGDQVVDEVVEIGLAVDPAIRHEGWSPPTVSRPDAIHASVPPATLTTSMPSSPARRRTRTPACCGRPTWQITYVGPSPGKASRWSGTVRQRDRARRPGTWPSAYSSGSRTSTSRAAGGEALGELVDVDLLDGHARQRYRAGVVGGRQLVGRVDVAQRGRRRPATSTCAHARRRARAAPARRRPSAARASSARRRRATRSATAASGRCRRRRRRRAGSASAAATQRSHRRRRRGRQVARGDDHDVVGAGRAERGEHPAGRTLARASGRRRRGRPKRASSARVTADEHDRRRSRPAASAAATRSAIATPATSTNALSVPIRRLRAAAQHGAGRAGSRPGAAGRRGRAGRGTAPSARPRRPRRSPRPSPRARRAPAGTPGSSAPTSARSPSPRQPLARSASRPRW